MKKMKMKKLMMKKKKKKKKKKPPKRKKERTRTRQHAIAVPPVGRKTVDVGPKPSELYVDQRPRWGAAAAAHGAAGAWLRTGMARLRAAAAPPCAAADGVTLRGEPVARLRTEQKQRKETRERMNT